MKILPMAGQIIDPRGPRLTLAPLFDKMYISNPDDGNEEGMMDGIHLPQTSMNTMKAYAVVTVESVGPDVKTVQVGDKILIVRAQATQIAFDGNRYWFTAEGAVLGVVR
jgi:co-chaperonin GroES (HSP10)